MEKLKLGVLVSGRGTDLQSILDASEEGKINAEVRVVISNNKDAYALERAKKHNIDGIYIETKGREREDYEKDIDLILKNYGADLVIGAGWMKILTPFFVRRWRGRLINIHPSLLPSFPGTSGQKDSLEYGVKITGCTTHFMSETVDSGPIILQAAVLVRDDDTIETLTQRILEVEHQILPRTIDLFEQNRIVIEGRRVKILPGDSWRLKYPVIDDVLYSYGY
ncbi:MAG: phosphoribosylglycinamide formyltransferase [Candidatus Methanoliparum thermophilum]|uniref:phosphoribosylglycinamide formyltransferase 1 n=1 Tax=Methanoliparum thermophilum TaxID=2491083 RepID=A0A520KTD1_METT2|nr:phosphoribosylglycinamide formyltransferase [Candidatus Methanoliparum sp. LAM-1]RZN65228.1 MAG: phosphoribosylglycinamide formyltransferase [Candidatus Methanoliparum thermophilum]BDC36588.1 phosphoribosylglycinamide formyltransferase [Candidatus Methanoliparum sp. LAM-1]